MIKRSPATHFSAEQYLALEDVSKTKHEFYDGKIYDMAGGAADHNLISANIVTALGNALASTPCRVFGSDMRILVEADELYTYPDVSVVCGRMEFDSKSETTIKNPIVLVEVLSPSTRDYDRGAKFKFYKKIASLQEVIFVEADRPHVEVMRRTVRGQWTIDMYDGMEATVHFKSLQAKIPLRQVYAKATWLD